MKKYILSPGKFIDVDMLQRAIVVNPGITQRLCAKPEYYADTGYLSVYFMDELDAGAEAVFNATVADHDADINPLFNPMVIADDEDITIQPHQMNIHYINITQDRTVTLPDPSVCDPLAIISVVDSLQSVRGNKRILFQSPAGVEIEGSTEIKQKGGKWFARPLVVPGVMKKWVSSN